MDYGHGQTTVVKLLSCYHDWKYSHMNERGAKMKCWLGSEVVRHDYEQLSWHWQLFWAI